MASKSSRKPTPQEVDGNVAVSFANTATAKRPSFNTCAELALWAREHGGLSSAEAERFTRLADADPDAAQRALRQAQDLVPALRCLFSAGVARRAAPRDAVDLFNEHLRNALAARSLVPGLDGAFTWGWRDVDDLERVFWGVLVPAAELLTEEKSRVRFCPGENCGLFFVVPTPSNLRKWCVPAQCGARSRMKRHYHRVVKPRNKALDAAEDLSPQEYLDLYMSFSRRGDRTPYS